MMKELLMKTKKRRSYLVAILVISAILIYFYLGVFFESGVDYYNHFLKEQETSKENPVTVYKGTTSEGKVIIKSSIMNQTDRLVEVTVGENTKEYVIESTLDCTKIRLFDSNNSMVLESSINKDLGTITTPLGNELNYETYIPVKGQLYNENNPDPIMLIIIANGLAKVTRGDFPKLMFAALIYGTLLVDLLFPDLFLRFKSLNFRDQVEVPKYYRKMQLISWIIVPLLLGIVLISALS